MATIKPKATNLRPAQHSTQAIANRASGPHRFDAFISYASEDKEDFVARLAGALQESGVSIWYEDFSLKLGDSLRACIDRGLASSSYGIVVLSHRFFEKHWPQAELNGLASREVGGAKVILPVWHTIDVNEVRGYSPMLADRVAVSSARPLAEVVLRLRVAMGFAQ